jgi:hypothetical protein
MAYKMRDVMDVPIGHHLLIEGLVAEVLEGFIVSGVA